MAAKKKYVIVGTGSRASMYIKALAVDYTKIAQLKAFCDTNQGRMDFWNKELVKEYKHPAVKTYKAEDFEQMIKDQKPDVVIVTSMDRTHHNYICRAMEMGCDVITEKPMTVDAEKCQQIIDTKKKTGKNVTVTFNYRYSPRNTKIKEIIKSGMVGEITSIHFEWLLDTCHGADYFRRWHRYKKNSGGLMVHKATHHFDLVNWWIDSFPETVFAMGDLRFYGKENAEKRGVKEFYYRSSGSKVAAKDPFALKITKNDTRLKGLYFDVEKEDNYLRDLSVFSDGITIEDNMGVMVKYQNKAVMTYALNAHSPWEGYRVCFNGTKGRLEFNVVEKSYVSGASEDFNQPGMRELEGDKSEIVPEIIFQAHWKKPKVITYEQGDKGGHGGGDVRLLDHLFLGVKDDPLGHAAGYVDGAKSILIGIAANKSMQTGLPVEVKTLVQI
jgi:predicted dehydrogenase